MQLENYRKMLLTISDDIRVILIKIADRMHNMRTMHGMPSHKQLTKASENSFICLVEAHRLGLYRIKTELEDQSHILIPNIRILKVEWIRYKRHGHVLPQ